MKLYLLQCALGALIAPLSLLSCSTTPVSHEHSSFWQLVEYKDGNGELIPPGSHPVYQGTVLRSYDLTSTSIQDADQHDPRLYGYKKKDGRILYQRIKKEGD
ncbi:hypothetical protein Rhal01_02535 [Rubritalea halochordaticola]|uniref:Lipoprotein n=1 Tax=Rubritalea halochordaticola TaxID=714537 RepID=A0ABP9V4T3_9BACT